MITKKSVTSFISTPSQEDSEQVRECYKKIVRQKTCNVGVSVKRMKQPSLLALTLLIAFVSLIPSAHTQQVVLASAQINVNNAQVSAVTNLTVILAKKTTSNPFTWQQNMCFELYLKSPYQNQSDYQSWTQSRPPLCWPVVNGLSVSCNLKANRDDTIQFQFQNTSTAVLNLTQLSFNITNFQIPFSAQQLPLITLTVYRDSQCTQRSSGNQAPLIVQAFSIQTGTLTQSSVTTTNTQIAYSGADNTVNFTFTPTTTMAPGGQGAVQLEMPNLYTLGDSNNYPMYPTTAINQCSSSCFQLLNSYLTANYITVNYTSMKPSCIKGSSISILCKQFLNPLYRDIWYGFNVRTYDGEIQPKMIEQAFQITLDTTEYTAFPLSSSSLQVAPADYTVNTPSIWTLSFNPNLPLGKVCYIQLFFPNDFVYDFKNVEASGILLPSSLKSVYATQDLTQIPAKKAGQAFSIVFAGCNEPSSLGQQPKGSALISSISTQRATFDSGSFGLKIFKDQDQTQLIAELNSDVKIQGALMQTGGLDNVSLQALIQTVQVTSLIQISFTTQHTLYNGAKVQIEMPPGFVLPPNNTFITLTPQSGPIGATQALVVSNTTIEIFNFVKVPQAVSPQRFVFALAQIQNQLSVKDAGSFIINTFYLHTDSNYYLVDTQYQDTSFTATQGLISANTDIIMSDPTNYLNDVIYTFNFSEQSGVPKNGYIKIDFPSDILFNSTQITQVASCANTLCTLVGNSSLLVLLTAPIPKNANLATILKIGGISNPRSTKPSGSFNITTYDEDQVSVIDFGFRKNTKTTNSGSINTFTVKTSNEVNGAVNTYSFSLTTQIPIINGDVLQFTFPSQLVVNANGQQTVCTPLVNNDKILFGISGQNIQISILNYDSVNHPLNDFSWTMTNIANPGSVAPSDGFTNIQFQDQNGYLVSQFKNYPAGVITNTIAANLTQMQIFQDSYQSSANNNYTITFTPVNALPATGSIKLVYPAQISLANGNSTNCFVTTNKLFSSNCVINTNTRQIFITGVFQTSAPYSSTITILLQNVTNPPDNRRFPNDGFIIVTYSDPNGSYIADLAVNVLTPTLNCNYPCASCLKDDRDFCTACWQTPQIPLNYLMSYPNSTTLKGQCKTKCDFGYTSNGSPTHVCVQCDESCNGCADNGVVGDITNCTLCSAAFPYRLNGTQFCLNTCKQGIFNQTLFQSTQTICGTCNLPCVGCFGTATYCTSCDQNSTVPNLWQNNCITTCPAGTTSVAGVCQPCESPCKNCAGSPGICLDCDGTQGRVYLLNSTCYSNCPVQYVNNPNTNTCLGCLTGCDACNLTNTSQCLTCGSPLFLYNDTCLGSCPAGFTGRGRVCIPTNADDLTVLYFPFLISAFIFTIVVFFGKLKKKAVLVNGKMQLISLQWSIVAIVAVVAPLQTLATIVQFALAIFYQQTVHFILALIVVIITLAFNISFMAWYIKSFYSKVPPEIGSEVILKGKVITIRNAEDQRLHPQDNDPLFAAWATKHKLATYLAFVSTGLIHFKTSKLLYSRFYMFDMFKAQWTKAAYLRDSMIKWQIFYAVFVDVLLIGVSIFGLLSIKWNGKVNQLLITMIETIVLSIYVIILGLIERFQINKILDYVLNPPIMKSSDEMKKYEAKKKKLHMDNLMSKVKHASSAQFKDNKLSDLLKMFGGRRCKSMIELSTGWQGEEDPRHCKTWPVSRTDIEEMELAGLKKFTAEDSYALQDNCYAEGVHKLKGKDKQIQGDAAKLEFQNALNRKHGDLMAKMDEEDEMHTRKGVRRRGRKNKYYNQIDLEDDQEVDPDEVSDKDADLQIIKEQEEEEEALRKMVQESSKKQQDLTAARTNKLNQERLTREQREERAAGELKLKQQQEAQALKKQQMIEALRLQQEELQRKQLEEDAATILRQREQQEAAEAAARAAQSEAARKEYEAKEAARIAAENEEKKRRLAEEEALLSAELQRAKLEKEKALEQLERERKEADNRKLLENQMLQEQQEQLRQQEKEAQRLKDEKAREERRAAEAAEKLAKQIADEKAAQDAAALKEAERQKEKERKEAERNAKEAEKAKAAGDAKLSKEQRHAKEEAERKLAHEQKEKDRLDRLKAQAEQEEAKKKVELPAAATSVLKNETQKIKDEMPSVGQSDKSKSQNANASQDVSNKIKNQDQSEDIDGMSGIVNVNPNAMKDFQKGQDQLITIPPNAQLRTFNEHDVLGDLDRDDKGNVVVLEDKNGRKHDKKRNPVNQRGYLSDPKTNDIIENMTGQPMFASDEMDERGEVPAPFCIEKYNFNPHNILGDFDYSDGKPILMKTAQGFYVDKKARRVNNNGWFTIPNQGHIVDKDGRKKFDKRQLAGDDLHKLFNYGGKRFDIKDVMGQIDKDQYGNIRPHQNGGKLFDNLGRQVNEKGYLIDQAGNIIDVNGRQLWLKTDLKAGEFPKIFPFTKFNIQRVQGEIEISQNGTPILNKGPNGQGYVDRKGRLINVRGYLIDRAGNVVDHHGKLMFDKVVLEQDGEIPQVFRTGLLRSDTASSLSRLMSEIERNNQSEYGGRGADNAGANDSAYEKLKKDDGDTSVDSKMEDTPANYNMANQRFDSDGNNDAIPEDDEGGEHMAPSDFSDQDDPAVLIQKKKQKPKKKKKPKLQTIEFLEPTKRDKNMAGAYGGQAKGEIRRPGIKYDKERLANSKKFRVSTADEPRIRAQLTQLANTVSGFQPEAVVGAIRTGSKVADVRPEPKRQGLMKASDGLSSHSKSMRGNTTTKNNKPPRNNTQSQKKGINDADFEQMFGKDIDQFLEDSEWDIESQDKQSQGSRGSRNSLVNAQKLKAMEKVYLKRMEGRPDAQAQIMNQPNQSSGSALDMRNRGRSRRDDVKGPDRETIIAITDDPGVIHRGEILPFATKKTYQQSKR